MKIYGVAILAGCYLAGQFIGEMLGSALGIGGNVGGVGFAMAMWEALGLPCSFCLLLMIG